jgi:hypothetical protein
MPTVMIPVTSPPPSDRRADWSLLQRAAWSLLLTAVLLLSLALALAGPAAADPAPARISGRVVDVLGRPVAGANVHVASRAGVEQVVKTDREGRYQAQVRGGGTYTVVFAARGASAQKRAALEAGGAAIVDAELELADGEVIQVRGEYPRSAPKPLRDPRLMPKYSDQAILRDAWTKAWLLLDVSAAGEVQRLKVLKAPGYDLDQIAVRTAFDLKLEPARDASGKPVPAIVVWSLEWPSYGWLQAFEVTTRIPPAQRELFTPERPALVKVPCANSGRPLAFESRYPTYRDCSRPDISRAAALPWIARP